MTEIRRLTDSCVLVTTDQDATLFDPGFHTFGSGDVDPSTIGDVTRVCITHEHSDHVSPEFVRWLVDRNRDLTVHCNNAVMGILQAKGIAATTDPPPDVVVEDVLHDPLPNGATPPNRSFTIEGVFTHPGDSRQPTRTAPVMALPLMAPWGSVTGAIEFARRLAPQQVIPIHDFYLAEEGRGWLRSLAGGVLKESGITLVDLDWGDGYTI